MKYYVISNEQVCAADGTLSEYISKGDGKTEKQARTEFFNKCAAINADLSAAGHTFAKIRVLNSMGDIIEQQKLGGYIETDEGE